MMNKFIVPIVLTLIVSGVFLVALDNTTFLPPQASAESQIIDSLFDLEFQLIAVVFALCLTFLVYSIYKFRRKAGDDEDGEHFEENTILETTWTLVPVAIALLLGFHGATVLNDITDSDPTEVTIQVTGRQWSWLFESPEGVISADMVLLVDQPVILALHADDVIHSFWVPEFRVKQDAVPGITTNLRFTPNVVDDYQVLCAELCGQGHHSMRADVRVLEQEEYDAWLAENGVTVGEVVETPTETSETSEDAVAAGQQLALVNGCVGCHSIDGSRIVGPTWLGVYGSEETLDDGSTVVVDEDYLRESIIDPNAQIVESFAPSMPANFGDLLSDEDIDNLIAYIVSLADEGAGDD